MKCDPRVVSLKGIQAFNITIEDGNHLRVFVGTEHGFFAGSLAVYRRPASDKLSRLKSFNVPTRSGQLLTQAVNKGMSRAIPVELETNDPMLKLHGSLTISENKESAILQVSFPKLIGYLEIQSVQPPTIPGLGRKSSIQDDDLWEFKTTASPRDKQQPAESVGKTRNRTLALRNRNRIGLKIGRSEKLLTRVSNNPVFAGVDSLLGHASNIARAPQAMEVIALYNSEIVVLEKADSRGHISLTNIPLDEIRITFPLTHGFRVQFLLMEEDVTEGAWTKFEDLPGPTVLLALASDPGNSASAFQKLLNKRFWSDVRNRFLNRDLKTPTYGWTGVKQLYGNEKFDELIELLRKIYERPGWLQRLVLGQRWAGGYRAYQSVFAARNYDPELLGLLLALTMDSNIATVIGLKTVDRGQDYKLPERSDDWLKQYQNVDWRQSFDYKIEGKWTQLEDPYAYIYYNLGEATTPKITGAVITKAKTLDGVEIRDNNGHPTRMFRVGLAWGISQDHHSALVTAYDVFRDNRLLIAEDTPMPTTPARYAKKPDRLSLSGRNLAFQQSLPTIPPFSAPSEIGPAEFQYVDATVRYGPATYAVESVDIFGRYSSDRIGHECQVGVTIPIPVPTDLRAEICRGPNGNFEVVTRWEWPASHRALAPDWIRFEVFYHDGPHKQSLNGSVIWIEKLSGVPAGKFKVEAFANWTNAPISRNELPALSNNVILRCAGRSYNISEVRTLSPDQSGIGIIQSTIEAKTRTDTRGLSTMRDLTRGGLLKRVPEGVLRIPFFLSRDAQAQPLAGSSATSVCLVVSKAKAVQCSSEDRVLAILGELMLGGTVKRVGAVANAQAQDGIATVSLEVEFERGWAEYYLPLPTSFCSWMKRDLSEWIDWDDTNNWAVGPVPLLRPTEYPLKSSSPPQKNKFPVNIAGTPKPKLSEVNDENGQYDSNLSSIVLPTENFAAPAGNLLTGCQLSVNTFQQTIKANTKGENPQIVITSPQGFSQAQAETLLSGKNAIISQSWPIFYGAVEMVAPEVGETLLKVTFDDSPLPILEWRLCAVEAMAQALPSDPESSYPLSSPGPYYFRILTGCKLPGNANTYMITVVNLIREQDDPSGIEKKIKFEITPTSEKVRLHVPALFSATFDISLLNDESAAFYRTVDGGEISYGTSGASQGVTSAVAICREGESSTEKLHVAFFPPLNEETGFKESLRSTVYFFPSFRLTHSPAFLSEESLRNNLPVYVTVRAVVNESNKDFNGPLAPVVRAPMARGKLELSPPPPPLSTEQPTLPAEPVYARPGPRGSTYTLSWSWDAHEFKVYRIPADFVSKKAKETPCSVTDILNDLSLVEETVSLRNRSQLREMTFTDVFEGRGAGRYYYKIIALDKTGTTCNWADGLIIPDPDRQQNLPDEQRGVIVLDTVPPDTPALNPPCVVNGKVQLEWQSDPTVNEYWIYRSAEGLEADTPRRLRVLDIGNTAISPRLEQVPIVAGTESEPIRCMPGDPPVLALFWMPDMCKVIGLYHSKEYRDWLANPAGVPALANLYPGSAGEVVRLKHRDGTDENIQLDATLVWNDAEHKKPGVKLAVEYLTEHKVRLPGFFQVEGQKVVIRQSPDIAVLVGIYRIEGFDPQNPQNPLSGTLDLAGPYPVIRDICDGETAVAEGYRPVIVYKQVNSAAGPVLTIYGAYLVRNGTIELISGPELPIVKGTSAGGSITLPAQLAQPASAIVGVYRESDYHSDQDTGPNLYNNSYNGVKITGINLPDDEPVVIIVRQLEVDWRDRSTYHSLHIEGYAQAAKIDSVTLVDRQNNVLDSSINLGPNAFDPANPDVLNLPAGSIVNPPPPDDVIVRYTDDAGMKCSVTVVATGDSLNVARSNNLPGGLAPYIADFLGVWRLVDYDSANPDPNLELVVKHGNGMFRRRGSFIQVHENAGLPDGLGPQELQVLVMYVNGKSSHEIADDLGITSDRVDILITDILNKIGARNHGEAIEYLKVRHYTPLVIRFRDHMGMERGVASKPGWLRFTDVNPYLNTTVSYQVKAVKTRDDGTPNGLRIGSRLSLAREVTLMDPSPPIPPALSDEGLDNDFPLLSWPVVEGIAEYRVQRRTSRSPAWRSDPSWIFIPLPAQTQMTFTDDTAESGQAYEYRLLVIGDNGKPNKKFKALVINFSS